MPEHNLKKRAVVFANGQLTGLDVARAALRPTDWLIAADGGVHHCRALGLTPHIVVGDFDSLAPDDLTTLQADGTQLIQHPTRKDQTDLELALSHAVAGGADDILILGALGGRWDQTLANLLLLARPGLASARIRLLDGNQQLYLIGQQTTPIARASANNRLTNPTTKTIQTSKTNKTTIEGCPGDTVSLVPLRGDARGVTTHGLEYPLDDGTLPFGKTLGISNVLLAETATVEVRQGLVMCVVINESYESANLRIPDC